MFAQRSIFIALFCAVLVGASPLVCQTSDPQAVAAHPDYGAITEKHYVNGYFGFSYRYPEGWEGNVTQPSNSSASYMYTLFTALPGASAAAAGDMRYMSIDVDVLKPTDTPKIFMDASIKLAVGHSGAFNALHTDKHYTFGGKQFYRVDLVSTPTPGSPALYRTMVFTLLPNYAATFSFMATSPDDIESLVRSMESLSFAEPANPARTPIRAATGAAQPQAR